MFSFFNKRDAVINGKGRASGYLAGSASSAPEASDEDLTFHLDIPVDDAMRALDSRLSSLSHIEVGQAAKERGWATLQRELERHPVRPAAPALLKGTGAKGSAHLGSLQPVTAGHSRGWRVALTSAGAVVVILAAVLGVYGTGLLSGEGPEIADTTTTVTVIAVVPSTDVTEVTTDTTAVTGTTVSTEAPDTTETSPVTTETVTTDSTPGTTPTSGGTTVTTKPNTPTTKPASTTTTNGTIMVSADREHDAQVMAGILATAVIDHFLTGGSVSDVARHVAPTAQASLSQMIQKLDNPTSGQVVPGSAKHIDSSTVRFTLKFVDVDDTLEFFVWVHVDGQGATITKISAAS